MNKDTAAVIDLAGVISKAIADAFAQVIVKEIMTDLIRKELAKAIPAGNMRASETPTATISAKDMAVDPRPLYVVGDIWTARHNTGQDTRRILRINELPGDMVTIDYGVPAMLGTEGIRHCPLDQWEAWVRAFEAKLTYRGHIVRPTYNPVKPDATTRG